MLADAAAMLRAVETASIRPPYPLTASAHNEVVRARIAVVAAQLLARR